jgi:hypothetical protein
MQHTSEESIDAINDNTKVHMGAFWISEDKKLT